MEVRNVLACIALVAVIGAVAWARRTPAPEAAVPPPLVDAGAAKAELGALIFADPSLSEPAGQSCATCHDPKHAFSDPRGLSTSEGAIKGRFAIRNAPSILYASFTPALVSGGGAEPGYNGGFFWDGRADTLLDQVKGPLLNPLEMNNADATMIVKKLAKASYAAQFTAIYGAHAFDNADAALVNLSEAVAAYEAVLPGRFKSKYDQYLAGKTTLTDAETRGLRLFEDEKTGPCDANACGCAQCHLDKPSADGAPPLFTDFGYDNIGIPHNPATPNYDPGLGAIVHQPSLDGQFKAPTLRNVAVTAPYGHNGYFRTLKDVIHFYNTRDVAGAWFPPEHRKGMNLAALGSLRLSDQDESDLVSFLETLTDAP